MTRIKIIAFDMCGVLVEDTYDVLLKQAAEEKGVDYITFMTTVRENWDLMETGMITEKAIQR